MSTFRTDYFPPSNRRRCVKGRSSYTESSDIYLSAAFSQDENSIGFSQNEDNYIDSAQTDDGDEEDITIDVSAFLNDTPLLDQAAFETPSENNIVLTESSSQFRVTDCKVDPSEIAEVTDTLFSLGVSGDSSVGNVISENITVPHAADSQTFIPNNAKENSISPEKILTNVTNSEPAQSITLNGKKTLSPVKKFSKALGLSNPLKKYKNFIKSKDLNKANEKAFGKYPIVKCEKLDIENFVKNNKIKIRNWPLLHTENKKNNSDKGANKKKVNLNKSILKPRFMKKPINFHKYFISPSKSLANHNNSNILGDKSDVSKPIIIKTDSWKPEVANVSPCVPSFFRPLTKSSVPTSKNVACDLLNLNDKAVSLNVIASPKKKCDFRAKSGTTFSSLFNSSKSYPLIAPKLCAPSPIIHSITTTKPLIETLTIPVADNFTVIEPYVDDPTSPQKPKPILTVPVEVVSSPEKQNSVINPPVISNVGIITNINSSEKSEKLSKAEKSIFLNGGIRKIIVPTKSKSDIVPIKTKLDIIPTETKLDIVPIIPSKPQSSIVLNKIQSDIVTTEIKPNIVPTEMKSDSLSIEAQSDVVPTENQSDIVPAEAQSDIVPTETEPDNVSAEFQSDILSTKTQSEIVSIKIKDVVPAKTKSDFSSIKKEAVHKKSNQENLFNETVSKVPVEFKVKDISSEENFGVLKAKNIVVDAMQSAFCSTQNKKNAKTRSVKKTVNFASGNSLLGFSAYSSILNDNILNGFSENDFEDISLFEDDSFTGVTDEISAPSEYISDKMNTVTENSSLTPKSIKKARERKKHKRKKSFENSETNSTLLVSQNEIEGKLENDDKKSILSRESNAENIKSLITFEKGCEKSINNPVHPKKINESVNKDFETKHADSSLLFPNIENHISESQDNLNCNKFLSPKMVEQTEMSSSSFNEDVIVNLNSPVKKRKENDKLKKQETSTRTLRNRKCSSAEVKNSNNSIKQNPHEKNSPEKNKIKDSINSKLKIQLKSPKSSTNIKLKQKFSKPADIIEEINTITGGHSNTKRGSPRNKKSNSEKDNKNSEFSNTDIQNDSESNLSNEPVSNQLSCLLSMRKKSLKVSIKRSKRKNTLCSKVSLNTLTDVVDNANISNSVTESNLSLHSSFREAKDEKMGTLQKEENSAVNRSSIPEYSMEKPNEKLDQKEQVLADSPDSMVKSSETPLLEDNSNSINSDVNCTLSNNFLVVENKDNSKELLNDFVNHDKNEIVEEEDKNVSSEDSKNSESLVKESTSAVIEISPVLTENSKSVSLSADNDDKNSENDSEKCESLMKENNSTLNEIPLHLRVESSEDIKCFPEDNAKISEESKGFINENKELAALVTEKLNDSELSESVSVELINKTILSNDDNNVLNENFHNICDAVNQDNKSTFEEKENTLEKNIEVNSVISTDNGIFKENIIPEETIVKEMTGIIDDDSKPFPTNSDNGCVEEGEKLNSLISTDSLKNTDSKSCASDIIDDKVINCSDVLTNELQADDNNSICFQIIEDLKASITFPDNSTLVGGESLVLGESTNNTSSDHAPDVSHEFSEKDKHISESVKPLLLRSVIEDKITVSEETGNFTDAVSNLAVKHSNENTDNSQMTNVSLSVLSSSRTPEKENLCSQVNSIKENQKISCQINKDELNESFVSNETSEAQSDSNNLKSSDKVPDTASRKEIPSIRKKSSKNVKSTSTVKSKKCPKIKIFKKTDGSPDSLKNWFVSESSETENKSSVSSKVFEATTETDGASIINSDKKSDLNISPNLNGSSSTINNSENDHLVTKPNGDIQSVKESDSLISEETDFTENSVPLDHEISSNVYFNGNDQVIIKEEPMDIEENTESGSSGILDDKSMKDEQIPNKKKRGRPRKSVEHCNTSVSFNHDEVRSESEQTTVPVIPRIKEENISDTEIEITSKADEEEKTAAKNKNTSRARKENTATATKTKATSRAHKEKLIPRTEIKVETETKITPKTPKEEVMSEKEVKITPGASSSQKKKGNQKPFSTPTSGRKKNYDPELVCVPFSMGWTREHVIRATAGNDNKRQSDIYYFSPEKTKLRSMPDILNYLSKHPHIQLSAVNFTFAKELIYCEPFEIERGAKQAIKKVCITPVAKKSPKKPKALTYPADSTDDTPPSVESKKKVTPLKRKSSLKESDTPKETDVTSKSSNTSKKSRQSSLNEFLDGNKEVEDKSSRPSRKIVRKIPFDNSAEIQPSKKPKSGTIVTRRSSGIQKDLAERESLILKISLKSPSKVTKDSELPIPESSTETKKSGQSNKAKKSKESNSVNTSSDNAESMSSESLLSRTNIKSPAIHNRLKVKLGLKKELGLHKPCTKFCNFAYVRSPTIQCTICLCLFHSECIPFKPTGLTKYSCVACITSNIKKNKNDEFEFFWPDSFDIGMLYPLISLQILQDNALFNATFNKFFSPVNHSFTPVSNVNNISCQRPIQTYSTKNMSYPDKNHLRPLLPRQTAVIYRPSSDNSAANCSSNSFTVHTVPCPVPKPLSVQQAPNINVLNIRSVNPSNLNSVQLRTANPGSLPLLQKFGNTFFVQRQPFITSSQSSVNVQNTFQQSAATTAIPCGPVTNADGSNVPKTIFVRKLPNNQQISGLISSGNIQNISEHIKNVSVLKSLLQTNKDLQNKPIKLMKFQDFSAFKISPSPLPSNFTSEMKPSSSSNQTANNIPSPLFINATSQMNSSSSSEQDNNIPNPLSISVSSEMNLSSSSKQTLSSTSEFNNNKRKNDDNNDETTKRIKCDQSMAAENSQVSSSPHKTPSSMDNFSDQLSACWNMDKVAQIYECFNFIFKFLDVRDLLRASLVCRTWNQMAKKKELWQRVTFSGITVKDWVRCCKILKRRGTKCINFRGMHGQDSDDAWEAFLENVPLLTDIEELIFEKVPPYVIKRVADSLSHLKNLTCYCLTSLFTEPEVWSTPCEFELTSLRCMGRLQILKISSMGGIHLKNNQLSSLPYLPNLTHLVLTGFKFISFLNLECISQLQQLVTLELGDCYEIEPRIYGIISQLKDLENLCLQNGGDINDEQLCEVLLKMDKLKTLELMNFQFSYHLPDVLKKMNTLCHLNLWPDTRKEAGQVNFISFKAAISCTNLKKFTWGVLFDGEDNNAVPGTLQMKDSEGDEIKTISLKELFDSLVKQLPEVQVVISCSCRNAWSEFCSARDIVDS